MSWNFGVGSNEFFSETIKRHDKLKVKEKQMYDKLSKEQKKMIFELQTKEELELLKELVKKENPDPNTITEEYLIDIVTKYHASDISRINEIKEELKINDELFFKELKRLHLREMR